MLQTHKSFCRFCHANCAIEVDVEDGKAVAIRGDRNDEIFHGYTCLKGRELHTQHNHPDRLIHSQKRQSDGSYATIASAAALDEIAAKLGALIEAHGPRSVAVYCGTYAFQNSAGVAIGSGFAKGIGSPNFFTSVTLDQPAKTYLWSRVGLWGGGLHCFSDADVVMIIGNNAVVSQYSPPGGIPPFSPSERLRKAQDTGTKVIVIDPRESEVAGRADLHVQVQPGADAVLLAGILNVIFQEGLEDKAFCQQYADGVAELRDSVRAFTPELVAEKARIPAAQVIEAARIFAGPGKRGAVTTGTGPEMSPHAALTEHLVECLNIVCGRFYREGEESKVPRVLSPAAPRPASVIPASPLWGEGFAKSRIRGLTQLGEEMPCNVLADEILTPGDGQIKALINIGGNPVVAFPNQDKIVRALESLELLVSIDVKMAQTTAMSDYVIAPKLSLERDDITILSEWWYEDPFARYTKQMLPAPGDTLDEWEVLWGLSQRLGMPIQTIGGPIPIDAEPTKFDALKKITHGCRIPLERVRDEAGDVGKVFEEARVTVTPAAPEDGGRFTLNPQGVLEELAALADLPGPAEDSAFHLVSRRTKQFFNSTGHDIPALAKKGQTNYAHMHPDDLSALGLTDGDTIALRAKAGAIHGVVKASSHIKPGVISMAHAFGLAHAETPEEAARHGATTNRLVRDDEDYDPITGMARQSAIPVTVQRV